MELAQAIKLVADDTRENTDSSFTDREAIVCTVDDLTEEDVWGAVDDPEVRSAYLMVLGANENDLAAELDS